MTPVALTVVAESHVNPGRYRELAQALEDYAGSPVRWIDGSLADVEDDSFVLFASLRDAPSALGELDPARADHVRRRLVVFEAGPREALAATEVTPVAAAVDRLSLLEWSGAEYQGGARGPVGLRRVGESIGAACTPIFDGDPYCLLESDRHEGLPHLLVDYLRAYGQLML